MKSLPIENCSEDLVKAMSKQGLVQKDVTVQGKNGKTFTRKQWVKASDAQSGPNIVKKTSDDSIMSKDPNMGKTLNVRGKQATVKDYDKLSLHEKREGADSIVDIAGQRYDYYSNSMHNGIGSLVPHKDDPKIDMNSSQFKVGDKGMITLNSGTIPIKVLDKATLNHKLMYLVQEDRPLAGSAHMRKFWTADYNVKSIPDSKNTKSKKTSDGKTVSIQHTSQAVQVTQNSQGKGTKLSKEDAKKKTQSYTNKVGKSDSERQAFMDKVKSQGITWKEDGHTGINWMRCCMAMNKHFAEGGSFDEVAKVNNIGSKNPYHNTPGFENVIPYHVDHTTTLDKFFDLSDSDEVYKGNSLDIQKLNQSIKSLADSWGITKGKMYAESSKDGKKTYLVCESKDGVKSRVYTYHNKMTKQQGFINSERKLDVFIHTKGNTLSDSEYDKLVNQACKDYISTLTPDKQKKANEFMPKRGTFVHWERVKNILSIK